MIDSVYVSGTLTLIFGAAGLLFLVGRGAGPPTTVSDRVSGGIHVAASAAMIPMAWSWGSKLPVWPQVVAFTLAAGWFVARVVRGRLERTRPGGAWWHDLHHAATAGTLAWSIAAMSGLRSMGSGGDPHARDDMMPTSHHHEMPSSVPASAAHPGNAVVVAMVVLTAYFVVAAWPWLSTAVRAARRSGGTTEPQGRRHAVEAASHAVMSIGMAAMFVAMA
ncbi:DUF5134 domain-containing protein [Dactylosporangium sp. McL0621]|uniref:DUF5134 domain-containing protein n=1 Tax=Dactylosporangium sp. McL0621 TaxID=3415678 RepID=UPI003CFA51C6